MQLVQTALRLDIRVYYVLALVTLLSLFYVGSRSSPIILFVFVVCTGSLVYAIYLASWVLAKDEGPPEMSEVPRSSLRRFKLKLTCVSSLLFFILPSARWSYRMTLHVLLKEVLDL